MSGIGDIAAGRRTPDPALRGLFSPRGSDAAQPGDILASFKGVGSQGRGRESVLNLLERFQFITPDQRAAGGAVGGAAQGAAATTPTAAFPGLLGDGVDAASIGAVAGVSDNPVYGGLWAAQMRAEGFDLPHYMPAATTPTAPAAAAADEVLQAVGESPIAAAADDAASEIARLEDQLVASFRRLAQLDPQQQVPTLAAAVDAGAAAGLGDDAFGVLTQTLASRPIEHSISALDGAIAAAATHAVADAAPTVVAAAAHAAPAAAAAGATVAHAAPVADDALRGGLAGVMSMAAGLDDTLRLLARIR